MKTEKIKGFENYTIDEIGRVFSLKRSMYLKQHTNHNNYLVVGLNKEGTHHFLVHRLVGEHFIDNTLNKKCINHKDGNKHNNVVDNLEWVTHSENMYHSYKNGLMKPSCSMKGRFGKNNPLSKKVIQKDKETNKIIKIWDSMADVSRHFKKGVSSLSIACRNNKRTFVGYKWDFHNGEVA